MSTETTCCQNLAPRGPSPFELTMLDWWDGPTNGFARCSTCGRTYHFDLIATDEEAGERVYALKQVTRASYDAVVAAVATAASTPAEGRQLANAYTLLERDSLATGFERKIFVLTDDLARHIIAMATIEVARWRSILGAAS